MFWICIAGGAEGTTATLLQTGESFYEVASLETVTVTPLLVLFFSRRTAISPINIRKVTAANDPMRGHLIFSKSDVDPGSEV